mmetsp:Transcript_34749/g.25897  ORF Transcript_34749/g.25897 Transcript_34749/m.25897 type:complete len:114 (-) Transcript_34749:145-486(-)
MPRPVFGSSTRQPLAYINNFPGPSQYSVPSKAIEGSQFSIQGRYRPPRGSDNPGPNQYQSMIVSYNKGKRPPSYSIGAGPKECVDLTSRRIVPGPGAYNQHNLSNTGVRFGKS